MYLLHPKHILQLFYVYLESVDLSTVESQVSVTGAKLVMNNFQLIHEDQFSGSRSVNNIVCHDPDICWSCSD